MIRRNLVLATLSGLACFGFGLGAARVLGWGPPVSPAPTGTVRGSTTPGFMADAGMRLVMPSSELELGEAGPRILFDPDSITLLPDASLHLDHLGDAEAPGFTP